MSATEFMMRTVERPSGWWIVQKGWVDVGPFEGERAAESWADSNIDDQMFGDPNTFAVEKRQRTIYTGNAAIPKLLDQHQVHARDAWNRIQKLIDDGDSVTGMPLTADQIDQLHAAACGSFWLYPVVCLRIGVPQRRTVT